MAERISNYEITKKRMQPEFLKYDQSAMIEKFGLENDADNIYITLFSQKYRVCRKSGVVYLGEAEANHNAAMTIYDILCYSKPGCAPSGELANMHSMSTLHSGSVTLGSGLFDRLAYSFDGREAEFARACEALGGSVWGKGDVSYKMHMFDGLDTALQFWSADEEFPPTINIFVDKNILQYMHFETIWYAVSNLLEEIKERMQ